MNHLKKHTQLSPGTTYVNFTGKSTILIAVFFICTATVFRQKDGFEFQKKVDLLLTKQIQDVKTSIESLRIAAIEKNDPESIKRKIS